MESLVIDPARAFNRIPDDLIISFSEGHVSVLDIACGTGAAGASILSTISVLRANSKLPKNPLDISIVGGDCSDTALTIYEEMIDSLKPTLSAVGIEAHLTKTRWEAEESYTTSEMFDLLFDDNSNTEEYLIIVANFAGTLTRHFSQFEDSIRHILDRTSNKKCTIIWVESKMESARTLFKKLEKLVNRCVPWRQVSQEEPLSYDYDWYHPFQNRKLPCRVLVKEYRRR